MARNWTNKIYSGTSFLGYHEHKQLLATHFAQQALCIHRKLTAASRNCRYYFHVIFSIDTEKED